MFKEILQIIPKLSGSDLNNMETSLQSRFTRVGKKFGKGLVAALTGGGIIGAALGLVDKLLNPLKETQDAIDRSLKQGDDLVTNAKQFNTTSGKLARLHAVGQATGLDSSTLDMMVTKFQTAVAEAKADPTKQTSVRQFVNVKDSADAFFEFIQSLKKMTTNQQLLVQQEVFGEKQILHIADFLQSAGEVAQKLGGPTSAALTPKVDKLGALNDQKDLLAAQLELHDLFTKGSKITSEMVKIQNDREKIALTRENAQIDSFKDLAQISIVSEQILQNAKDMSLGVASILAQMITLVKSISKISESPLMRGIKRFMGGQ